MRNTTYRVIITQEGNAVQGDSVERLRKYNQHRLVNVGRKSNYTFS